MADEPIIGSQLIAAVDQTSELPVKLSATDDTPPRLIVELKDNALRDLGVVTVDGSVTVTGGGGDGAILDGVSSSIKATVFDFTNSNPVAVTLRDTNGDAVSVGGGTQYTEDVAAAADPTGTALNLIRKDTLAAVTDTDGDNLSARGTNKGELYVKHADTIAVTQSGTWDEVGINDSGNSITVDGAVTVSGDVGTLDQLDLTNSNPAAVAIVDGNGDQIISFGGGTQYTEGDTDATITGTAMMMEGAGNALVAAQGTAADGLLVNLGTNNDVTVTGSVTANAGTNLNTSALNLEATQADVRTSVQLIDDTVATLGTTTYTETGTKGLTIGAVRRDADTTLVDTTNEIGPLQMDANGRLKVEAFSGETLPISAASLPLPTGASTLAEQQTQTTALQLIDDTVYVDDTATHATGTSKGLLMMAAAAPTDAAVNANDIGAVAMSVGRELHTVIRDAAGNARGANVNASNQLSVSVDNTVTVASHAVTNAGTFAVQATAVGTVADDGITPGAPVMVGGQAKNFDGTAPGNVSAEDDVAILTVDRNRRLYVNTTHAEMWHFHSNGSSALTDTSVAGAPGANEANFITDVCFSTNAATAATLLIEEGASTILGPMALEAIAGRGCSYHFTTPHRCTTNTAITVTTSAAIAHSVEIHGFVARVD